MINVPRLASGGTTILSRSVWFLVLLGTVLAMPASANTILIDDFDDGNDESWHYVDDPLGLAWGPAVFQIIDEGSDKVYRLARGDTIPAGEQGFVTALWDESADPQFSNGFLRARIRTEHDGTFAALVMRLSGSLETGFSGYWFGGDTSVSGFNIEKIVDTSLTPFADLDRSFVFGPNEDWMIEAGAVDDQISLKVWRPGEPEPPAPQLTVTDATYSTGTFGVVTNTSLFATTRPTRIDARFDDIYFTFPEGVSAPGNLQAGDADRDHDFDQLDLVQVQIAGKYLAAQAATWGEGDWDGAPGGMPGEPPTGNGLFDQFDIIAAAATGAYLTGPYAAIEPGGQLGDGQTSVGYDAATGEVWVDAPSTSELTSINIDSASGIFIGDAAQSLGGSFDNDTGNNVFKATFGSSFGSLSLGNVAQAGLSEAFLLDDLTVVGSLAGGGHLGDVDLVYVPEPSTLTLLFLALLLVAAPLRRGGRARHPGSAI